MAQRLKSDWLLFGTVVAMVGFGLVMVYSASSVVAQLNPHINSSFYYAEHQLVWAVVSFVALMFFKRRDYRMLQSPVWAFGSLGMVLFLQILCFSSTAKRTAGSAYKALAHCNHRNSPSPRSSFSSRTSSRKSKRRSTPGVRSWPLRSLLRCWLRPWD